MAQPDSCLDCHANSRPQGTLTSKNSSLSSGISFDHAGSSGDCAACHSTGANPSWTSWKQGKLHLAGDATPSTCLPCHAGERPTSTTAWTSTTYKTSPFDYTTNAAGSTHGDGQDCALCHAGPGNRRLGRDAELGRRPLQPRRQHPVGRQLHRLPFDPAARSAGGRDRGVGGDGAGVRPLGQRQRRVHRLPRGDRRRPTATSTTPTLRRAPCRAATGRGR